MICGLQGINLILAPLIQHGDRLIRLWSAYVVTAVVPCLVGGSASRPLDPCRTAVSRLLLRYAEDNDKLVLLLAATREFVRSRDVSQPFPSRRWDRG
jgi:hypothetical protein